MTKPGANEGLSDQSIAQAEGRRGGIAVTTGIVQPVLYRKGEEA